MDSSLWESMLAEENHPEPPEPINRVKLLGSVILDSVYMVVWAIAQFTVHWIIQGLLPDNNSVQRIILFTLQALFAVSTFAVVLAFVIYDSGLIWIRVYKKLKTEANE